MYHLVDTPRKLAWVKNAVLEAREFAFDIETNFPTCPSKIKPEGWKEVICGVSFSWGRERALPWEEGNAAYIPLVVRDDSLFWGSKQDVVVDLLKEILESEIPKIAQYGKFDVYKLYRLLGIKTARFVFDTSLAHALIDEERMTSSHALKSTVNDKGVVTKKGMSDIYLRSGLSIFKEGLEEALDHYDPKYRRYQKVPLEILSPYACSDADYTLGLKFVFESLLAAENLTWLFHNITMPLQHELTMIELHGVPLEIARAKELKEEQEQICKDAIVEASKICGYAIEIGSPKQLGTYFFDVLKLPGGRRGKKDWSVDDDILEKIDHPLAVVVKKYRRAQKIATSYVIPFLDSVEEITNDGRIGWVHTNYYPDSLSGRLRGDDPSLMTLPKPENGGKLVKSMFIGDEDHRFVFKDYSQIELKFIAHCSGEPVWVDGFNAGYDMHAAMAQKIWHPDISVADVKKLFKASRSKAKAVNFGIAFGESEFGLSRNLGISVKEAEYLINVEYFGAAPVLKQWIDAMHAFAEANGYVYNIFGRIRHLPNAMIQVPQFARWPAKDVRPECYRRDCFTMGELGIDDDAEKITETYIQRTLVGRNLGACAGCDYIVSCIINREVGLRSSKKGKALRQAVNSPIQGGAADMMSMAMVEVGAALRASEYDAAIMVNIHDEIGVYCKVDHIEPVGKIMDYYMCDYMQHFLQFKVPITIDTEIVHRWSDKK